MALRLLRHRRANALTSLTATTLHRPLPSPIASTPPPTATTISPLQWLLGSTGTTRSSSSLRMMSTNSGRQHKLYREGDEITEDTILFEGCDYNHWLITVDFPKDNKPPPEEMVATYESICAKGLNISIEEAKKRIYACSTTTYEGFQAVMTEEQSEKFKDVEGVVFVLPDSYIDPINKEYGGDKYENGVITHRPPPVQYQRGGRERNRNQPRFNRAGPMPNQQGTQYSQQGPMQGGRSNYGPQSNYQPQQNYGPQPNYQPQQNYGPQPNYPPQQNYGPQPNYQPRQNYGPPGQEGRMPMNNREFSPGGRNNYQSNEPSPMPSHQGNYNQGQQQIRYSPEQRDFPQGDRRDYGPPGQRDQRGNNMNYSPTHAGNYGQGGNASYGQRQPGDGQRFSPMEQRNMQGESGNNASMGQGGWSEQGRY